MATQLDYPATTPSRESTASAENWWSTTMIRAPSMAALSCRTLTSFALDTVGASRPGVALPAARGHAAAPKCARTAHSRSDGPIGPED